MMIASLVAAAPMADAQGQLPDLMPVVVDAGQGYVEVRNIGNAVAKPSQVYVVCSMKRAGKPGAPCGAGLHLPGYIEKWNVLPFDIPALQPGATYPLHLFGSGAFPRQADAVYGMNITTDSLRQIDESNETNNHAHLSAVSTAKSALASHPQKQERTGNINFSIMVNKEPVKAEIKVVKAGETRVVYWTHFQPGGPALPSPIRLTLPAGTYDIHIKPSGQDSFVEKTIALEVKSGDTQNRSINLQAGHLEVHAQAGGEALKAPISILQDGVPLAGTPRSYVYTPFSADLAPGTYTLVVTNPKDRWKKSVEIRISAKRTENRMVSFASLHAGFINIRLLMDGRAVPQETFTSFAEVKMRDAANQEEVVPISGGYGAPALLPSGVYDIHVTQHVIGGDDSVFKGIHIVDGQTVDKSVTIPGSGELSLAGRWTHQPTNLADCAHYNNPFNAAHLGALMGGHSVSRGNCLDPVIRKMAVWISTPGRTDGNVGKIEGYDVPRKVTAGIYDITAWPTGHRELAQTMKRVEITTGGVVQKKLEFRWPGKKK